jgi:glycosyltransferase involved in cell wall biosynthesis
MRSIAFLLDDSSFHAVNLADPMLGNPAIGGTEYGFVSLAHELARRKLAKVTLITRNPTNTYPDTLTVATLKDYPHELRSLLSKAGPIDCVIVRGHDTLPTAGVIESIPESIPIIAWTHNHLKSATLSYLARCGQIKRVVYVGREQCALAAGAACEQKATYIVPGSYDALHSSPSKEQRAVYLGSLVPQKGFHRLARLWPSIRRACPTAELDVIGSGAIQDPNRKPGSLGVALPSYEKLILRYLRNDPAKYGVVFHGKMGPEKYEVMGRALVGLPNPTGYTECCPASVVEMSGCGAAIVAQRQWGMCDTVVDGVTGYLCRDDREYIERVISLFKNPETARSMGVAGQRFVQDSFSHAVVCEQWTRLLDDVIGSVAPKYETPSPVGRYPLRSLRTVNRRLHSTRLHAFVSFVDRVRGVFLKRY